MHGDLHYESQKTMTKFAIQVFFLQNAIVEYIGVYSDTNNENHHGFKTHGEGDMKSEIGVISGSTKCTLVQNN